MYPYTTPTQSQWNNRGGYITGGGGGKGSITSIIQMYIPETVY